MWCFVDGTQCSRDFKESDFFPTASISSSTGLQPLVYSYATCGYVDVFSEGETVEPLRRAASSRSSGKLRVAFPSDSGSGYTVVSPPKVEPFHGVGGTNRSGSFLRFMDDIFTQHGIPWEEVPVSLRSQEFSPNSFWTACVHEVAIGNADMCWGNFWPTATRRMLTSFASTVYDDKFYVIVYKQEAGINWLDSMIKPLTPFSPMLWLVLLLVFGYSGITMVHQNGEHAISCWKFCLLLPSSILKGWHSMFTSETTGVEVTTIGGWLTALALGFSVLVLFTGYTAVVTTDLMTAKQGSIQNLEEGIQRGFRFCSNANMKELLLAQYPDLQPYLVDTALKDAVDRMDAGACDAAIIQEDLWRGVRTLSDKHCKGTTAKVKLPNIVATVANTVPVRPDLAAAVSWAMSKEVETGRYVQYQEEGRLEFLPPACTESTWQAEKTKFTVWDMAGPLMSLGIISTLSSFITCISIWIRRRAEKLQEALDEDGDGNVTNAEMLAAIKQRAATLGPQALSWARSQGSKLSSESSGMPTTIGIPSEAEDYQKEEASYVTPPGHHARITATI